MLEVPKAFDSHTEVYNTPEPCDVFIFYLLISSPMNCLLDYLFYVVHLTLFYYTAVLSFLIYQRMQRFFF